MDEDDEFLLIGIGQGHDGLARQHIHGEDLPRIGLRWSTEDRPWIGAKIRAKYPEVVERANVVIMHHREIDGRRRRLIAENEGDAERVLAMAVGIELDVILVGAWATFHQQIVQRIPMERREGPAGLERQVEVIAASSLN